MATLSSALNFALAGLSVSASQSALVSRNVSYAGDENYTRKSAEIYTLPGGAPVISATMRSTDKQLLDKLLGATSSATGQQALLDAMSRLSQAVGDPQDDGSLAALLGGLQASLKTYEANPSNITLANAALEQARTVVAKLNASSQDLADLRSEADTAMSESVARVNALLAKFKSVNDSIVRGSGTARDLSEYYDQRDTILKQLSDEIGIRTVTRPNDDVLIYAEGGAVLFEGSPRSVTMQSTAPLAAGASGQAVFIDGVPVTGPSTPMPATGGRLPALAQVRDELTVFFQRQLDEIASGLIRNFAESDQSTIPTLPDVAGLFVDSAGGLPVAGTQSIGLASRISLNSLADPRQGGNPLLIRDGGFGGAAYVYNQQSNAAYQDRIGQLIESFDSATAFDSAAGLGDSASLKTFSVSSAAWVESQRQTSQASADAASAGKVRASEALLRITGVNIDQEMAALLDLEKSYQASSKVISVVDSMLASLLEAVR